MNSNTAPSVPSGLLPDLTGASWQTRGKWCTDTLNRSTSGYGPIPPEHVAPWHVDATGTEDEGFVGTLQFPMRRTGRTFAQDVEDAAAGRPLHGFTACSHAFWAALWSVVPGAVVSAPEPLPDLETVGRCLTRPSYLKWREYSGLATPEETAELAALRSEHVARREAERRRQEEEDETPYQSAPVTWRGKDYPSPTTGEVREWVMDSVCETPDGRTVEPDHPDSWLRLLGLV